MKVCKPAYFSLFFLFCFTASFSVNALQNFYTPIHKSDLTHTKSSSVSNKEEDTNSGTNLLLEKNENEIEKSLCVQSFFLPFYISYFKLEISQPVVFFIQPAIQKQCNPIYIEVRNFRI